MPEITVNPEKLTQELIDAGLPVAGVSSDGRVDYYRELTSTENTTAAAIIAEHDPALTTEETRLEAYFAAGITVQKMVFALWAKIMQDDPAPAAEIQAQMETINTLIN